MAHRDDEASLLSLSNAAHFARANYPVTAPGFPNMDSPAGKQGMMVGHRADAWQGRNVCEVLAHWSESGFVKGA
jgi:hypothetical protein